MGILATPLLQYLELLLETSEEEDIELINTQVLFLLLINVLVIKNKLIVAAVTKNYKQKLYPITLSKYLIVQFLSSINKLYWFLISPNAIFVSIFCTVKIVTFKKNNLIIRFIIFIEILCVPGFHQW